MAVANAKPRLGRWAILAVTAVICAAGCYRRSDMDLQPKFWKVYRPTDFFTDGQSARQLPEGVVPREWLRTDREFYFAKDTDGKLIDHFPATYPDGTPFPASGPELATLLKRGQQRYNIYCIVCHGPLGYGDGMVVQRGFPAPPSYHSDKLLHHEPIGHYYDVISNGYGAMYSYSERIEPKDRWAVVAYVKTLQLSQNGTPEQLQRATSLVPPVTPGTGGAP
jgi:mono/diheme cytochrome c family protein